MLSLSLPVARWSATASFVFDVAAQLYGMLSEPNMKTIHDNNLSFFSPQPIFIAGFFLPLQLLQLAWLYKLWKPNSAQSSRNPEEPEPMLSYAPFFILANVCLGTWMFFWNASMLKVSNMFVAINTIAQIYFVAARLHPMNLSSRSSVLTHLVSKAYTGLGVLDILHNTSVAYFKDETAGTLVRVLTGVGFGLGSAAADWILGACLVYDLIALAAGQSGSWRALLGMYAGGSALIVAARNFARPPYRKFETGYESIDETADENAQ